MQSTNGFSLIVAMTSERVIGRNNTLPWRISSDLQRFKKITTGHPIVMGRKNWESIPKRPLPERTNIVLTRQTSYVADGAITVDSIGGARMAAENSPGADEIFIIGGEEIYQLFLPFVWRAYVTEIHASIVGDTYFPEMPTSDWKLISETEAKKWVEKDEYPTSFRIYERR